MQPKWITSMEIFYSIISPVLDVLKPKVIAEIGAAEGGNTRLLFEFCKKNKGQLLTIDPFPRGSFVEWVNSTQSVVKHYPDFSLNCIKDCKNVDVWFVDGDHNWYTVFNELNQIHKSAVGDNRSVLIYMHDVAWPCGRRDMYYDPSQIPSDYLQPCSNQLGLTRQNALSPQGALKGPYWALHEGGSRNGVLAAVEDFLKNYPDQYEWICIPAFLGLGVLIHKQHPAFNYLKTYYEPYHNHPIMQLIESDRISHYLTAMQLTQKIDAQSHETA